jgi:hypothetical protein
MTFSPFRRGAIGKVGSRWVTIIWPWDEDVREYGCPVSIAYFGKRLCVGFRPFDRYQPYNWRHRHYCGLGGSPKKGRRLSFWPRNPPRLRTLTCECAQQYVASVKVRLHEAALRESVDLDVVLASEWVMVGGQRVAVLIRNHEGVTSFTALPRDWRLKM